jgi:hypothetical protein
MEKKYFNAFYKNAVSQLSAVSDFAVKDILIFLKSLQMVPKASTKLVKLELNPAFPRPKNKYLF